ncbi:MAG: tRNA guanosine(34) transglycosylase Tgt [Candidatus Kerfeldbacteria bacterium CG08_land_8_20_14_0_20_43_14]|uniref:Queuine tRNA-ribosyltransferase n=1 Tax=Candidatus Kerfeldbacteria bacterium CG08_land_8_20_14_0_20_43_14 TaxID=2014246 RepID=A0A2H0YQA7_9BACT|nr:MAG: tRNA guanosine(34) transglycosylase Tgt [Candidatus Kerfeldbacteria bacterium CG08_land_8_20_14_0_20_43_14]
MISFKLLKKSKKSRARLGLLKTPHGTVQTPAFVGVATQATIKTLTGEEIPATGTQLAICNTFHLHLKPGENIVKTGGGLHKFANFPIPLMTDSGGFQVFSFGFGRDLGIGKVSEFDTKNSVKAGHQPKEVKITKTGVWFRSPIDGKKLFLGPQKSIAIQEKLGADIILAFDECPPPNADYSYNKLSLEKTHAWAKLCLKYKKSKQALYGIVQGGKYQDLRIASAKFIGSLPFNGFAIGGEFGADLKQMRKMLEWVNAELPENKPRHLLGIGHLKDIPEVIKSGVDTFDCIVPTHYARHGTVFSRQGKVDIYKTKYLHDKKPLDSKCQCYVCKTYTRAYLSHLYRARELSGLKLLTFHNLFFFNALVANLRQQIKNGKI